MSYNPFTLDGKEILVTGASSGIGRGIAIVCSKMGASVVINGRSAAKLQENLKVVYDTLVKARPSTIKGSYIKNVSVAATMGPGIKVDSETIAK